MSKNKLKKVFVLIAAAALLLAGCAGANDQEAAEDDPKGVLDQALENLADYEGITVELSVESTTDSLTALSEGDLNDEQAQQILDSSVAITAKQSEDPDDQQFELVGNVAGEDGSFELKVLGTTLFVRADVDGLMETFGGDTSELTVFEQQYGSQPGFEFIGTLLDGEWVSMTGAQEFAEQMTGQSPESQTEEQKAMTEKLAKSLQDNSSVEAGSKEGPGGHLVVSLGVQDFYSDFKSLAEGAGALATGGQPLPGPGELPDEDLVVDVWVSDEQVTQVELDITQFADWETAEDFPEGVDDLSLRMGVQEFTGEVEEPEAAAEVDFGELMQMFMGSATPGSGSGEGSGSGGGDEEVCDEIEASLEGQADEVIEQAKELYGSMCPNL